MRGVLRLTLMLADGVFKVSGSLGVEGGNGGRSIDGSEVRETEGDLTRIVDGMGEKGTDS